MLLARLAEIFAEESARCRNDDELGELLHTASGELDFKGVALVNAAFFLRQRDGLGLITFADSWRDDYIANHRYRADPVWWTGKRLGRGFEWREARRFLPRSDAHDEFFRAADRQGFEHGFTQPLNVPGEPFYCCSFACRNDCPLSFERRQCASTIGIYAIAAARRIRGCPTPAINAPHLTPRELDCLKLIVAGKPDTLIAEILGVALPTVRTFTAALRRKFDVTSRAQLHGAATRAGILDYDD